MQRFGGRFGNVPPAVLNLLIINVILFLATSLFRNQGFDLTRWLALYYPGSEFFRPYQLITHMFMHGGVTHLFFNMFALWMFGRVLEGVWGSQRFLIYYFITGLGAAGLHLLVNYFQLGNIAAEASAAINTMSPEVFAQFVKDFFPRHMSNIANFLEAWMNDPSNPGYAAEATSFVQNTVSQKINIPTVGASGAVFGVLLAFGMLFPNTRLMLIFPPIPIKAKWFVIGYGVIELYSGIANNPGDNVAHFAHLGGMIFGFLLIKYWNKNNRKKFY
jgi:membrane associated rhomboid family serine protease